jgi:hypothetical protein
VKDRGDKTTSLISFVRKTSFGESSPRRIGHLDLFATLRVSVDRDRLTISLVARRIGHEAAQIFRRRHSLLTPFVQRKAWRKAGQRTVKS